MAGPAAIVASLLAMPTVASVPPPRIAAGQLAEPLPLPYAAIGAEPAIAAARARAIAGHKRLLIDMGANWCLNCRMLAAILRMPAVATFVRRHYEMVTVDIGRFDRNMAVPLRLGLRGRAMFVPAIVVVDPLAHRIVNHGDEMAIARTGALTPQQVVDRLARWAA